MRYIWWILPSGRIHSSDLPETAEEVIAEYADLLPNSIFFYTEENHRGTEDSSERV